MLPNLLTYGAIGLGLSLAILTYRLIQTEQSKPIPRSLIINTTYAYMILTIILSLIGFISESLSQKEQILSLKELIRNYEYENNNIKLTLNNIKETNSKFEKLKHTLDSLTSHKSTILKDWKSMDQSDPAYIKVIRQIRSELININNLIQNELADKDKNNN